MLEEFHFIKFASSRANIYSTANFFTTIPSSQTTIGEFVPSTLATTSSNSEPKNGNSKLNDFKSSKRWERRESTNIHKDQLRSASMTIPSPSALHLKFSFDKGYMLHSNNGYDASKPAIVENCLEPRQCVVVVHQNGGGYCIEPSHHRWHTIHFNFPKLSADYQVISMHVFEADSPTTFSEIIHKSPAVSPISSPPTSHSSPVNCTAPLATKSKNIIMALAVVRVDPENRRHFFLKIYGAFSAGSTLEKTFQLLTDDCQTIPLPYSPLLITDCVVEEKDLMSAKIIMVASKDGAVYGYRQHFSSRKYIHIDSISLVPFFKDISSPIVAFKYEVIDDYRIVAAGAHDGSLWLSINSAAKTNPQIVYSASLFSSITSITFFKNKVSTLLHKDTSDLNLLVTCSVDCAVVFCDIFRHGLSKSSLLPDSNKYDSILCGHVCDVDFDGVQEILLGTFGCKLLVYKQVIEVDANISLYKMIWKYDFLYPIYSIKNVDLLLRGLQDLCITSVYGIHFFQPKLDVVSEKVKERLEKSDDIKDRLYSESIPL